MQLDEERCVELLVDVILLAHKDASGKVTALGSVSPAFKQAVQAEAQDFLTHVTAQADELRQLVAVETEVVPTPRRRTVGRVRWFGNDWY